MKCWFLMFFFLSYTSAISQTIFQAADVDSAAGPRGGIAVFNTFVQANLRKPLRAQADGKGGPVFVSGVVETDGRISDISLVRSFRPDCGQEALRLFALFNAWKPAQKSQKLVRQHVTMRILFPPNLPFHYANGVRIQYFTSDGVTMTTDSSAAQYKKISRIDTLGMPVGDVIVYEVRNNKWKEFYRLAFVSRSYSDKSCQSCRMVGLQNKQKQWQGDVFMINEAGICVLQQEYEAGSPTGTERVYHPNGLLTKQVIAAHEQLDITKWYANGQISEIKSVDRLKFARQTPAEQVTSHWDSAGVQTVRLGEGVATYQDWVRSKIDTNRYTRLTEQGGYQNTYKHGVWKGEYADGSYYYKEVYDNGILRSGKAKTAQSDTIAYIDMEQMPEFQGGMGSLRKFLSENLTYPASAHRSGVQGQVWVNFVVCTDGTLCDYEVIKSVEPSLDQEALRVVKKMSGKWKPGSQRGEKVRVKYTLPVNFSLY